MREQERLAQRERERELREQRERDAALRAQAMQAQQAAAQQAAAQQAAAAASANASAQASASLGQQVGAGAVTDATKGLHAPSSARPLNVGNNRNLGRGAMPNQAGRRGAANVAGGASGAMASASAEVMPNAASTLGGVSASNNQPMPALNDPELANNYRGVVPPRTNANMNNAKLPGGAANAVKPNNMGYAGQNPLANPAPKPDNSIYRAGVEYDRRQRSANYNNDEPHYITPGAQHQRRNQPQGR